MQAEGQVQSQGTRYRSKVDAWLAAVLVGAFVMTIIVMVSTTPMRPGTMLYCVIASGL